jgi:hypothetical protein
MRPRGTDSSAAAANLLADRTGATKYYQIDPTHPLLLLLLSSSPHIPPNTHARTHARTHAHSSSSSSSSTTTTSITNSPYSVPR